MDRGFYRAFEEHFRGSREIVRTQLEIYLPFLGPFISDDAAGSVLDLGCGRGEWLELLQENGFSCRGVDLDDEMLSACRERGFSVENCDVLQALRATADESQSVVSAIHLVEHLKFEDLADLMGEAFRVLIPGGLLILETPNPENQLVATNNFYLDPTHQRPFPPQFLSFLAEYKGFDRVQVVRGHPPIVPVETPSLRAVLEGASADYAVVAQKGAPAGFLERFDSAFNRETGILPEVLMERFEQRIIAMERCCWVLLGPYRGVRRIAKWLRGDVSSER